MCLARLENSGIIGTVNLIINYAKTSKSDIIILGSRGQEDRNTGVLGSISNGILCSSKIPFMIIK